MLLSYFIDGLKTIPRINSFTTQKRRATILLPSVFCNHGLSQNKNRVITHPALWCYKRSAKIGHPVPITATKALGVTPMLLTDANRLALLLMQFLIDLLSTVWLLHIDVLQTTCVIDDKFVTSLIIRVITKFVTTRLR